MSHHVYRVHDESGRLIYVGSSRDVRARLAHHASAAWWAPQISSVTTAEYPTKGDALRAERDAIATEHPRWNVLGRWSSRAAWTDDHWRDYLTAVENTAVSGQARTHLANARRQYDHTRRAS